MSQRNKTIVAVLLLVALGVVLGLQFTGVFPRPGGGRPAKRSPTTARVQERPAKKPAVGREAQAPSESKKESTPLAEKPLAETPVPVEASKEEPKVSKEEVPPATPSTAETVASKVVRALPKLGFISEEVEERFQSSRFFVRAPTSVEKDPFQPVGAAALPPGAEGAPTNILEKIFAPAGGEKLAPTETFPSTTTEVPLLPLPSEPLEPSLRVTVVGVCKGTESTTALITLADESGKTTQKFFARPGWLLGQDYIFLGVDNGFAKLLDRKTNQVIQLKTGGTL